MHFLVTAHTDFLGKSDVDVSFLEIQKGDEIIIEAAASKILFLMGKNLRTNTVGLFPANTTSWKANTKLLVDESKSKKKQPPKPPAHSLSLSSNRLPSSMSKLASQQQYQFLKNSNSNQISFAAPLTKPSEPKHQPAPPQPVFVPPPFATPTPPPRILTPPSTPATMWREEDAMIASIIQSTPGASPVLSQSQASLSSTRPKSVTFQGSVDFPRTRSFSAGATRLTKSHHTIPISPSSSSAALPAQHTPSKTAVDEVLNSNEEADNGIIVDDNGDDEYDMTIPLTLVAEDQRMQHLSEITREGQRTPKRHERPISEKSALQETLRSQIDSRKQKRPIDNVLSQVNPIGSLNLSDLKTARQFDQAKLDMQEAQLGRTLSVLSSNIQSSVQQAVQLADESHIALAQHHPIRISTPESLIMSLHDPEHSINMISSNFNLKPSASSSSSSSHVESPYYKAPSSSPPRHLVPISVVDNHIEKQQRQPTREKVRTGMFSSQKQLLDALETLALDSTSKLCSSLQMSSNDLVDYSEEENNYNSSSRMTPSSSRPMTSSSTPRQQSSQKRSHSSTPRGLGASSKMSSSAPSPFSAAVVSSPLATTPRPLKPQQPSSSASSPRTRSIKTTMRQESQMLENFISKLQSSSSVDNTRIQQQGEEMKNSVVSTVMAALSSSPIPSPATSASSPSGGLDAAVFRAQLLRHALQSIDKFQAPTPVHKTKKEWQGSNIESSTGVLPEYNSFLDSHVKLTPATIDAIMKNSHLSPEEAFALHVRKHGQQQ